MTGGLQVTGGRSMGGFVLQLGESGPAEWEMFSIRRTNSSNQSQVIDHEIKNRELEGQGLAWSQVAQGGTCGFYGGQEKV